MHQKQLLGVTGFARSGKSQLLRHLSAVYDYEVVGASAIIRAELEKTSGPRDFSREEFRTEGMRLRRLRGPDFVIRHALSRPSQRIAVDGIRNLQAVRTFLSAEGVMLGLVARPEVRLGREMLARDGKLPNPSIGIMLETEAPELNSLNPHGMQLLPVLWSISPDHIIDTSDLTVDEMCLAAETILTGHGIHPANS